MDNKFEYKRKTALFVCGTYDDNGGRFSYIGEQIYKGFSHDVSTTLVNGGSFSTLEAIILLIKSTKFDYIVWIPNVDNSRPKLISQIKEISPTSILVTSKRVIETEYHISEVISHALKNKSNLVIEFSKFEFARVERHRARLFDPLGNLFFDGSKCCFDDWEYDLGQILFSRVKQLAKITRSSSMCVGKEIAVPNNVEFFNIVKRFSNVFDDLIVKPATVTRFLGNASFRCASGFPSFRSGDKIFVSRRNVDKHGIGQDGFVAVNQGKIPVEYYGDNKPSVDTPIQVKLYDYYKSINYIIHGHVYVKYCNFTNEVLPCGALEEFDGIVRVIGCNTTEESDKLELFAVNLKGHGFIIGVKNLKAFNAFEFVSRPLPENVQ